MERMLAVISGATSKVMNQLINQLIHAEYRVIALSRNDQKDEIRKNVLWIKCDLTDAGQDFSFLKNAELLIHAAANSNMYSLSEYLNSNYAMTINLVNASINYNVKKFIYISSLLAGYNYGDYGISKIKSEEYIANHLNNWLIIRPSQLFGYSKTAPIDNLVEMIKRNKFIFCPVGDKKGLYPLYYNDLVKTIFESSINSKKSNTIITTTGCNSYTYKGLANQIAIALNRKINIIPIPKAVILICYYIIKFLHLRIGIYPDQLFRLYNCNNQINISNERKTSINDHLKSEVKYLNN
jgi:nucleoside-diphosphate-sugar epimerase